MTTSTRALALAAGARRDTITAVLGRLAADGAVGVTSTGSGLAIRLATPMRHHCVSGPLCANCPIIGHPNHLLWHPRAAGQGSRVIAETLATRPHQTVDDLRAAVGHTPRRALARLAELGLVGSRSWPRRWRLAADVDPMTADSLDRALERVETRLADAGRPTLAMAAERASARYERDRARSSERRDTWLAERRAAVTAVPASTEPVVEPVVRDDDAPLREPDPGLQEILEAVVEAEARSLAAAVPDPDPDGPPPVATLAFRPVPAGQVARGLPAALVTRHGDPVGDHRPSGHLLGPRTVPTYDPRHERLRFGIAEPTPAEAAAGLGPTPAAVEARRQWRAPVVIPSATVWWLDPDGGRHRVEAATVILCRGRPPRVVTADGEVLRPRGRQDVRWGYRLLKAAA